MTLAFLSLLQRYGEALLVFKEVLKQDSSSSDAAQELMKVQIMQLMVIFICLWQACMRQFPEIILQVLDYQRPDSPFPPHRRWASPESRAPTP